MRIAVTGASGHIGMNLLPELISRGHEIRVLAHRDIAHLEQFKVEMFRGDLIDPGSLSELVEGVDVVIHMGARISIRKRSEEALKVNIEGTRNMLSVSQQEGVGKFIHLSSIHSVRVFPLDQVLDEHRELNMDSPFDYDRSKAISEQMVVDAAGPGFHTVVLNPVAVLGPFDHQPSFLGEAIIRFYEGRIPAIMPGGYHWVDVRDVVKAIIAAIDKAPSGSKFMISGNWRSLRDLGDTIESFGGAPCPRLTIPFWLARLSAGILNAFIRDRAGRPLFTAASLEALKNSHRDISWKKAHDILDYQPRPFEESVRDTLDWFRQHQMIA